MFTAVNIWQWQAYEEWEAEKPKVKWSIVYSNGLADRIWALFDMSLKAKKMNEFYFDFWVGLGEVSEEVHYC